MSQGPLLFHDPVQMSKVSLLWMPQVREWLGLFSESHDPLLLSCSSAKSLYEAGSPPAAPSLSFTVATMCAESLHQQKRFDCTDTQLHLGFPCPYFFFNIPATISLTAELSSNQLSIPVLPHCPDTSLVVHSHSQTAAEISLSLGCSFSITVSQMRGLSFFCHLARLEGFCKTKQLLVLWF